MTDQTSAVVAARGADLDPEIGHFIATAERGVRQLPGFQQLTAPRNATRLRTRPRALGGGRTGHGISGSNTASRHRSEPCLCASTTRLRALSKPALLYMHGGGWTTFSIDTHDRLMREYAARADIVVIGVDYALSPEVKFPVAQQQIAAVVRWAREHSAGWAFIAIASPWAAIRLAAISRSRRP